VGIFLTINISVLQNWWMFFTFTFTFTLHCSDSMFHKEQLQLVSPKQTQLAARLFVDLLSKFNCINFVSRVDTAEGILSKVHRMCVSPIVLGSSDTDFPCQAHFMLVDSSYQALVVAESLRLRSRDHVIIFNLNNSCPEGKLLNRTLFGSAQVVVTCSAGDSVYRQDVSGDLHVVTNITKLFQSKASGREDYMGRLLRVSTFNCPPYSYGIGNGVNSSSYEGKSKHNLDLSIFKEHRMLLQRIALSAFSTFLITTTSFVCLSSSPRGKILSPLDV
jgi:hypothetical protein